MSEHLSRRFFVRMTERPWALRIGSLDIEAGGMGVKRGRWWIPDGLHIWLGSRGVHLFWSHSPHQPHIVFDRDDRPEPTIPEPQA